LLLFLAPKARKVLVVAAGSATIDLFVRALPSVFQPFFLYLGNKTTFCFPIKKHHTIDSFNFFLYQLNTIFYSYFIIFSLSYFYFFIHFFLLSSLIISVLSLSKPTTTLSSLPLLFFSSPFLHLPDPSFLSSL